jgi:hypothetical protein
LGIVFVAWTYVIEWINIVAMYVVIEQTGAEVGRIRREKGLDERSPIGDAATGNGQKTSRNSAKSR